MQTERIFDLGAQRVLLPVRCDSPTGPIPTSALRAIIASDRHSLLVTGETGTGKEIFADCIIRATKRPLAKCQKINCAGLDRNLIGSELFGHKKGAYTGADSNRNGLLKSCADGILFLDEIGWLPEDLQARLLRFMETGEIRPLGADAVEQRADVRIVAATNRDVTATLIPDLRHRFDFEVRLPSLRDRGADVLWFLCEPGFWGTQDVFTGITLRALYTIISSEWRGNIRELKKYCQRKALLRSLDSLLPDEPQHVVDERGDPVARFALECATFAGFALDTVERALRINPALIRSDADFRALSLLLAFLRGLPERQTSGESYPLDTTIPLSALRSSLTGPLTSEMTFSFQALNVALMDPLRGPAFDALAMETNAVASDLPGALQAIRQYTSLFGQLDDRKKVFLTDTTGRLENQPIRPSKEFQAAIRAKGLTNSLFSTPPPPSGDSSLLSLLAELQIVGRDRDICVLCHDGFSNKAIGTKLGIGPTTAGEVLVNLRMRHEALRPFLPKKSPGRKPARQ